MNPSPSSSDGKHVAMPPPYNSLPNVSGMITVKVVIDDTTRRLKLPYPILTAEQLPAKVSLL